MWGQGLWVVHGLEGSGAIGCVPCMIYCVTDRGGALHAECESGSRNPIRPKTCNGAAMNLLRLGSCVSQALPVD